MKSVYLPLECFGAVEYANVNDKSFSGCYFPAGEYPAL